MGGGEAPWGRAHSHRLSKSTNGRGNRGDTDKRGKREAL
jgi:hypothetical protein